MEHDEPPARDFDPGLAAPTADGALLVVPVVRPEMVADPEAAGEAEDFLRRVALALGSEVPDCETGSGVPE